MHNCSFALICRIVPHPSYLSISFNCGVWCGVWDLLYKMSYLPLLIFIECRGLQFTDNATVKHHSLFWSQQLPTNERQVWFFRWSYQIQPRGSSPSCCFIPTLLPRSGTPLMFWALHVPMPCAHLEGAALVPTLVCVFILHLLSKVGTK